LTASRNGSTSWRPANSTPPAARAPRKTIRRGGPIAVATTGVGRCDQSKVCSFQKLASLTMETGASREQAPLTRSVPAGTGPKFSLGDKAEPSSLHGPPTPGKASGQGSRKGSAVFSSDREARAGSSVRGLRPGPLTEPSPRAATSVTGSPVTGVTDLAAWRRRREVRDAITQLPGCWWPPGARLWTWDEAERSRGWSA
jgi:hypothetical protein